MTSSQDQSFNNDNSNFSEFYFLKEVISLYARNKKLILASTIGTFIISCIVSLLIKRTWQGEFKIVLEKNPSISSFGNQTDLSNRGSSFQNLLIAGKSNRLITEVEILKSPSVLTSVFQFVQAQKRLISNKNEDLEFSSWEKDSLDIKLEKGTTILKVAYKDTDKDIILPVLKKISETYQQYSGRNKRRSQELTSYFFNEQIAIFKKKSANSLKTAQEYALEQDLVFYDLGEINQNNVQISNNLPEYATLKAPNLLLPNIDIENARIQAANQIRKIELQLQKVKELNDSEELQYIGSTIPALVKEGLPKALSEIEATLLEAKSKYTDKDITILDLLKKRKLTIDLLKNRTIKYLQVQKLDAEATMKAAMRPKGVLLKYKELIRESERDERTLIELEDRFNLFKLSLASQEDPWELITNPKLLTNPVAPQRKKIGLFGALFGLIIGLSAASIYERRKGTLYSKYQVGLLSSIWPLIIEITVNKKGNMNEVLELFVKGKNFKEDNSIGLLFVGEIQESLINKVEKTFGKYLKNIKLLATKDLLKVVEFTDLILFIEKGKTKRKEILEINEKLIFQKKSLSGLFFLDNEEIK